MSNDVLTIAAYAAEQLLEPANEIEIVFVLTPYGPIVQIVSSK